VSSDICSPEVVDGAFLPKSSRMTAPLNSIVSWAIAQYEQVVAGASMSRGRRRTGPVRLPSDPPEAKRYYESIGLGRNVDAYA